MDVYLFFLLLIFQLRLEKVVIRVMVAGEVALVAIKSVIVFVIVRHKKILGWVAGLLLTIWQRFAVEWLLPILRLVSVLAQRLMDIVAQMMRVIMLMYHSIIRINVALAIVRGIVVERNLFRRLVPKDVAVGALVREILNYRRVPELIAQHIQIPRLVVALIPYGLLTHPLLAGLLLKLVIARVTHAQQMAQKFQISPQLIVVIFVVAP